MFEFDHTIESLKTLVTKRSASPRSWVNDRGNTVHSGHSVYHYAGDDSRYRYDAILTSTNGWEQFDTDQDAWYFGVWVNIKERATFNYAEGDITLVTCEDDAHMKDELDDAVEFYGAQPPMAIMIDDDGTVTHVFDERPTI